MHHTKRIARALAAAGLAIVLTAGTAFASFGTATVTADSLRMRDEPSTHGTVMVILSKGTSVELLSEEQDGWYKVRYKNSEGYMASEWLQTVTTADAASEEEDPVAVVTADILNIRSGPGTGYDRVGKLTKGTEVTILETLDGWYKITDGTLTGYASADYISTEGPAKEGLVLEGPLNVRSGPGTGYNRVGSLKVGTTVTILDSSNGWYQISTGSLTGYVSAKYVTPLDDLSSSPVGAAAAAMAASLVGCRYVYGAEGPTTFDCSGLSYYIFKQLGYTLARGSSGQYKNNGEFVSKANLQPGDLVFFFDPRYDSSGGTLPTTHMGIYVGNGQFIHAATTSRRVEYEDLDGSYLSKYIVGYKRIG